MPTAKELIAIVGPTGSGKSALALALAEVLDRDIISADSMQFYRGMEIGTAAPTKVDQQRVRHHFVSFLRPDEEMAAGEYQRIARQLLATLGERGRGAVVVGGSGLYISALLDGLFSGPPRAEEIRARLTREAEEQGKHAMYARLREIDAPYASTITSPNDLVRVVRALEVYELTGQPFSALHAEHRQAAEPIQALRFGLEWARDELYARINARVDQMITEGWLEEVRRLLDAGYVKDLKRLKALGYRELVAALAGEKTLEEAVEATKQHHRRYAKRQLTWFRADKRITWLPVNAQTTVRELRDEILKRILP